MSLHIAITGAANGIGKELSLECLRQGHRVIGLDVDFQNLKKFSNENLSNFFPHTCDLSNGTLFEELMKKIYQDFGIPDIWINNAGISEIKNFSDGTFETFNKEFSLNFSAIVQSIYFWLPKMEVRKNGTIVNMGSLAGYLSAPGLSPYVASKFALTGFTKSLQSELKLKKSPVKLILVSPGFVETKMLRKGQRNGFPEELSFLAEDSKNCAKKIIAGIFKGEPEIFPTKNGNILKTLNRISPELTERLVQKAIGYKLLRND